MTRLSASAGNPTGGKRRTVSMVAIGASAILLLAACSGTTATEGVDSNKKLDKLLIAHSSVASMSMSPGYNLELDADILLKHGIEAEWTDFTAEPNNCISAVVAGRVDVCSTGLPQAFSAIDEGAKLRIIGAYSKPQSQFIVRKEFADGLKVSAKASLKEKLEALRGARITAPPAGSTNGSTLRYALASAGVDMAMFSQEYPLNDPAAMAEGLRNNRWDVGVWSSGALEQAIVDGSGIRWIDLPTDSPEAFNLPSHGLIVTSKFADANPDLMVRLNTALGESIDALKDKSSGAREVVQKKYFNKLDPKLWSESIVSVVGAMLDSPKISEEQFEAILGYLKVAFPDRDFDGFKYEQIIDAAAR